MNREDIIRMAREVGMAVCRDEWVFGEMLERFAALVAAAERERIIAANAPEIERCNTHIKALEDSHRFLEEIEAEWQRRCDTVKQEANYWHKRHDAVMDSVMKTSFFHAHPPVTLMAEPESFNAGKALAERQMMQLFTDPENQPTQHGTVTVEYMQREIAAEREACAKVAGWLWQQFQDTKDAHERNTMEPFKWGQFGFDQSTVQQSKRMMDAIRARGQA